MKEAVVGCYPNPLANNRGVAKGEVGYLGYPKQTGAAIF